MTRVGFEPYLASLKGWQPHQKSNGPYLCAHNLGGPGPPGTIVDVGWKALESFSPGLQPGAKPSQLPAHQGIAFPLVAENEKARCPLRDTGLLKARGRLWADVTCAVDTGILRYANLYSRNSRLSEAETGYARVALRAASPAWQTNP